MELANASVRDGRIPNPIGLSKKGLTHVTKPADRNTGRLKSRAVNGAVNGAVAVAVPALASWAV